MHKYDLQGVLMSVLYGELCKLGIAMFALFAIDFKTYMKNDEAQIQLNFDKIQFLRAFWTTCCLMNKRKYSFTPQNTVK
jgi:hypothetical protein